MEQTERLEETPHFQFTNLALVQTGRLERIQPREEEVAETPVLFFTLFLVGLVHLETQLLEIPHRLELLLFTDLEVVAVQGQEPQAPLVQMVGQVGAGQLAQVNLA